MPSTELVAIAGIPEERGGTGEFTYGTQRAVSVDVLAQGQWNALPDGGRACRYSVKSPGAVMLSVQFDRFHLVEGARAFLYNTDRSFFIGGFDRSNEQAGGGLATAVVPGDAVVIEVQLPAGAPAGSDLHVSGITHGYRDIFHFGERGFLRDYDPGYQSAACHNNVICPAASAWQAQKRAVAMFLRPDGGGCTGSLINNTAQNGTPYFYMANHCYTPDPGQWVFYFNYESPTCLGSTGPTDQTISGATFKSAYYYDDFCLLQLSSAPPESYHPYYAGWDRSGNTPTNQTVIHHPLYDVKKITFDNNPATSYTTVEGIQCWKNFWDSGIVEPVSSGSPLFDQNKRIIGHMTEGAQTCANAATTYTGCAKFSASWDGAGPTTRLRDWLDPANTAMTLNGYDPFNGTPTVGVKVSVKVMLQGPYDSGTQLMNSTLRDNGLLPLTEPYTGLGYTHVGGGNAPTTNAVLSVTGSAAIVDWVVVELRNKNNSAQVMATRAALVRRDGLVVDVNGTAPVDFAAMPVDNYFIAVRHRNHLGAMTATAQALSGTASLLDIQSGAVAVFGGASALCTIGTAKCLWAGDAVRDNLLKYTGANNDRDPILARIGGAVPTATTTGYYVEDVNMDGVVKYTGAGNDRDPILSNVGGAVPTATKAGSVP
ncbi:MAG: hypothetical protein JST66_12670 [Bacteroidetes bacterium]|nr:hypothetical protein [Bacteroidota bacterium]